jgi:hypothetical protein
MSEEITRKKEIVGPGEEKIEAKRNQICAFNNVQYVWEHMHYFPLSHFTN